jgi:AraC-like DNA-binding protein
MESQNMPAAFSAAYYQFDNKPVNIAPTRRDFYKIWLILHEGFLTLDTETVYIQQPVVAFLHPLVRYAFEPVVINRSGYWCIFTGEFLNTHSREQSGPDGNLFQTTGQLFFPDEAALRTMRFYFEQIIHEFSSDYTGRYNSCRNLVELLMHEGHKLEPVTTHVQQHNASTRLVSRFLNLLEKQYPITSLDEPLKLRKPADFARELAVHINHLNAVVQQVTGKSTRQVIAGRLLSESRALLYYSDWSVADIAYSLGFEYPNHFTTFFRKSTGQTPLSLRK